METIPLDWCRLSTFNYQRCQHLEIPCTWKGNMCSCLFLNVSEGYVMFEWAGWNTRCSCSCHISHDTTKWPRKNLASSLLTLGRCADVTHVLGVGKQTVLDKTELDTAYTARGICIYIYKHMYILLIYLSSINKVHIKLLAMYHNTSYQILCI